jgi:signal transduction histidine kinase
MLQNLQIRSKLVAILILPVVALGFLAGTRIQSNITNSRQADRINKVTVFGASTSRLVHELQRERDYSAFFVASGKKLNYGSMIAQRVWVNQSKREFDKKIRDIRPFFGDYEPQLESSLKSAQENLDKLKDFRENKIDSANVELSTAETLGFYDTAIDTLININSEIPNESADRDVNRALQAYVALSRYKEALGKERSYLYATYAAGGFKESASAQAADAQAAQGTEQPADAAAPPASAAQDDLRRISFQSFSSIVGSKDTWRSQFRVSAPKQPKDQFARLEDLLKTADVKRAQTLAAAALAEPDKVVQTGGAPGPPKEAKDWFFSMNSQIDAVRGIESELVTNVENSAKAARDTAFREAGIGSIIIAVVVALSILLSLLMARSMVKSLRVLREAANDVADRQLPGVVERLANLQPNDKLDFASESTPISVRSRDEIGQVSDAFNSVHRVAVSVATEQAALRKSVGDMFLNLARRNQALIDRQLELIDDLERSEADPDRLEELFRLDHLATRMRRNAEDLIVLSGAKPARRWSQPVPLADVIRAALAEVEDYTRVELLPIEELGVVGQAVGDVVHLLAELIENATAFSPPGTKVHVAGQAVSNGYVVEIEDRGIGMSDQELMEANDRLANPPTIDLALSQRLGLFVVGRLASRYGIKVQLRHSWYDGITALVLLPDTLIVRMQSSEPEAVPSTNGRGRAEIAPPVGTSAPVAPPVVPPAPAAVGPMAPMPPAMAPPGAPPAAEGDTNGAGEHLPIFEQARSDWFDSGIGRAHVPLRRHPAHSAPNGAQQPAPTGEQQVHLSPSRRRAMLEPEQPPAPTAPPEPAPQQPAMTKGGLPRRVPKANLAPGIATGAAPAPQPAPVGSAAAAAEPPVDGGRAAEAGQVPGGAFLRSPDDIRSMLSSYRTGLERGRHEATGRHERQEARHEPAASNAARERAPDGLGPFAVGQE